MMNKQSSIENTNLNRRRFLTTASVLAVGSVLATGPVYAAKDRIYTSFISNKAVGGYDSVSYFTESKPVKGSEEFSLDYMGATWLFSSQENLALFEAEPEKYAPQYGGYCAYAVAQGTTAKGDPTLWEIVDDKLFLNVNKKIKNRWSAKKDFYIPKSDANWPKVLN